ncbi:MAG: hypothetical protein HQK96_09330 [Nitrospirae bacterium]|nr:hypothetical protein [Nitrospirota bacterium]
MGGYAVSLHAQPRATKDLDILIKADKANADAVFRALSKFGAPIEGLRPDDFIKIGSFFRMGVPPIMVDIMPDISGVEFDRAWSRHVMGIIDAESDLKAPFISADDLIAAKKASGRPQDLADVAAIRKAQNTPTDPKPKRTSKAKKTPPKP